MTKLLVLILVGIILGQVARLPISDSGAVVFNDLMVPLVLAFWVISKLAKKEFIIYKTPLNWPILLFLIIAFFSWIINLGNFASFECLQSFAYLIRLMSYSLVFFFVIDIIKTKEVFSKFYSLAIWVGLIVAFLGFLQIVYVPNFEFMTQYGWDPHVGRLLSTFFDPNYAGGFLVFVNSLVLSRMLFSKDKAKKGLLFFAFIFLLLAIVFTYSRSAYLAFVVSFLTICLLKSWRLLLFGAIACVIIFFSFPRLQERIMGGFSLDATAKMRLESYTQAQKIIEDNLVSGIGYNNLRAVKEENNQIQDPLHQAAGGFDSTLLTILATTGIVGFLVYLWLLWRTLKDSFKEFWDKNLPRSTQQNLVSLSVQNKKSPPDLRGLGLGIFAGFLGLLVHSQFVNSLLYPHIMLFSFIVLGLFYAGKRIYKGSVVR